jgi:hypothetical protein
MLIRKNGHISISHQNLFVFRFIFQVYNAQELKCILYQNNNPTNILLRLKTKLPPVQDYEEHTPNRQIKNMSQQALLIEQIHECSRKELKCTRWEQV